MFFVEKKSKFVKYSCVTAFVLKVVDVAVGIIFTVLMRSLAPRSIQGIFSFVFNGGYSGTYMLLNTLSIIFNITFVVISVYCAIMAYFYKLVKLPFVNSITEKLSSKSR